MPAIHPLPARPRSARGLVVRGIALTASTVALLLAPLAVDASAPSLGASVRSATRLDQRHAPVGQAPVIALHPTRHPLLSQPVSPPLHAMNPAALATAKRHAAAAARQGGAASTRAAEPRAPSAAIFNGLNQPGLSAGDEGSGVTPPDSTGAIGPNFYVEFVNQLVGVFDRSNLSRVNSLDLGSFAGAPSGLTTTDVQIQWDPQANRWLYALIGFQTSNNYVLFGWSKTADPRDLTGGWCHYGLFTGSNLNDYPKLGHDANFLTVGTNVYSDTSPTFPFVTANIWAISKPLAGDSTCSSPVSANYFADATHLLKNADGSLAFTPVPANTTDSSANGYIVAAHDDTLTPQAKVMVWHVLPGPILVADGDLSVGSFSVPPSVPQPGTTFMLDSLDGRLTQAVAHPDPSAGGAEAVWTQHTVAGASGRAVVRWDEFLPATLTVRQEGEIGNPTDYFFNAAISPSSAGSDAAIFYNRGSPSTLAVIGARTRQSTTPFGQMDPGEVVLGTSATFDQETLFQGNCTANPCRWGDYSGASPDPTNVGVVWGSNQLIGPAVFGLAQWTTQNFAISTRAGVPAAPTGLSATAVSSSQINLSWTGSAGASSYKVERSPDGTTFSQIATPAGTSYSDTGLSQATSYCYRVRASNSFGDSGYSNVASATTSLGSSQAPQGNWVGTYGADGYALLGWNGSSGDLVSLPLASLVLDQGSRYQWSTSTTDMRALQSPDASSRRATSVYNGSQIRLHLNFPSAYSGNLHLYAVDWDTTARRESITVNDGSGPRTATLSASFNPGAWVNLPISVGAGGSVTVTVTAKAGPNAVLSGLFLG